jgi:16S rRNA (guanine527-N7)-methyltransferase
VSLFEFRRIVRANGLDVTEEQFTLLERYVGLLLDWNGKINLVSRRDQENVWFAHMLHSVSPWFFVELAPGLRILDLGTGGGLPGIPLAILRPDLRLTLLDSIRKKTDAVRQMAGALGLANVEVVVGRAEDVGREGAHRHTYDVVVARAVARLSNLTKWSRPFLKQGDSSPAGTVPSGGVSSARIRIDGPCLLTLKGGDLSGEVREAAVRDAKVRVVLLVFPGGEQIGLEEKKLLIVTMR